MTDAGLFVFGSVVFLIVAVAAFLFVYTRFREEYVRENIRDWAQVRPRGAPADALHPSGARRTT